MYVYVCWKMPQSTATPCTRHWNTGHNESADNALCAAFWGNGSNLQSESTFYAFQFSWLPKTRCCLAKSWNEAQTEARIHGILYLKKQATSSVMEPNAEEETENSGQVLFKLHLAIKF